MARSPKSAAASSPKRDRRQAEPLIGRPAQIIPVIGRTVTAAEIIQPECPRPPEALIHRAKLAVPEYLIALPRCCTPNPLPIFSNTLIDDLPRVDETILAASAVWGVFDLIKDGHLEARRLRRPDHEMFMQHVIRKIGAKQRPQFVEAHGYWQCRLTYPGKLALFARPTLWDFWRDPATNASTEWPSCDNEDLSILRAINNSKTLITQARIEGGCSNPTVSKRTITAHLPELLEKGLIHYPKGLRKGAAITPKGKQFLNHIEATIPVV
jgi:hypothetical protein